MHLTIFFLTLLVFSVSASNITDSGNSNSTTAQACSDCWKTQRDGISACQNIPSTEMADFATLTDDALAANVAKYPTLVSCLCTLSSQVNTIVASCPPCGGDIGQGLVSEASIVSKDMCDNQVATDNKNSTSSDNSNSSNSNNNSNNSNQGGDSTTNSNSGTSQTTDGTSSDATVNAQASDAISIAPWSKSIFGLTVAFVAAWLCAF